MRVQDYPCMYEYSIILHVMHVLTILILIKPRPHRHNNETPPYKKIKKETDSFIARSEAEPIIS